MYRCTTFYLGCVARVGLTLLLTGILTGCVTTRTVSAHVVAFQQWPENVVNQRYQFVAADPAQNNNLEYESFQDMVRSGIGGIGLVEAKSGQPVRFKVSLTYGVTQIQKMVRRSNNCYRDSWSHSHHGRGMTPFWDGPYCPAWTEVPIVAYRNALTITIQDVQQGGKEVYRATAYSIAHRDRLLRVMPYLVRAIFDVFPANNGSEREVQYEEMN